MFVACVCVYYIQLHAISGQPLFATVDIDRRQPPRLINGLPYWGRETERERESCATFSTFSTAFPAIRIYRTLTHLLFTPRENCRATRWRPQLQQQQLQ